MMSKLLKVTVFASALVSCAAQADVLDFGFLKGANLLALGNLTVTGNSVDGAAVVKGNASISNYSINQANTDAFDSYSLVVGGNLSSTQGSIANGNWYADGTYSINGTTVNSPVRGSDPGVASINSMAARATEVSTALKTVKATGTIGNQYGGLQIQGIGASVEVFDVTGAMLSSVNWSSLSNIKSDATLIFNVSGSAAGLRDGMAGFSTSNNVLFNFYDATQLSISNANIQASVLAPLATVVGSGGDIWGNAIVNNWQANVHIGSGQNFTAANVQGLALSVPEPKPWAMGLIGLFLIGFVGSRRRNHDAVKFVPQPQEPSE
jgi:choice-of-anchor A domain-containing protein